MWAWFAAFYTDTLAASPLNSTIRTVGLVTFGVIGAGAFGSWAGGLLSDRWGRAEAAGLAMAISGACALAIGQLETGPAPLVIAAANALERRKWPSPKVS